MTPAAEIPLPNAPENAKSRILKGTVLPLAEHGDQPRAGTVLPLAKHGDQHIADDDWQRKANQAQEEKDLLGARFGEFDPNNTEEQDYLGTLSRTITHAQRHCYAIQSVDAIR